MGYLWDDSGDKVKEYDLYRLNNRVGGTIMGYFMGDMKQGQEFGAAMDSLYTKDPYAEKQVDRLGYVPKYDTSQSKTLNKLEKPETYQITEKEKPADLLFGQTADEMFAGSDMVNSTLGFSGGKGSFGGSSSGSSGSLDMSSITSMFGGSSGGQQATSSGSSGSFDMNSITSMIGGSGSSGGSSSSQTDVMGMGISFLNEYGKTTGKKTYEQRSGEIQKENQQNSINFANERQQRINQQQNNSLEQSLNSLANLTKGEQKETSGNAYLGTQGRRKYTIENGMMYQDSGEGKIPLIV